MMHDAILIGFGLAVGLWAAANVWIWRYAAGYRDAIDYCKNELEPVRIEIAQMAGMHHVSEEMRSRMKAMQEEGREETRH